MTRSVLNTKGFEEYLEKIAQAGLDVDRVADEALSEGAKILKQGMESRAAEFSGHMKSEISIIGPTNEGNYHSVKIGLFNVDREKEMYFFYQEMGSAKNAAHPFIRPAFSEDMKNARVKMLEVFKARETL